MKFYLFDKTFSGPVFVTTKPFSLAKLAPNRKLLLTRRDIMPLIKTGWLKEGTPSRFPPLQTGCLIGLSMGHFFILPLYAKCLRKIDKT